MARHVKLLDGSVWDIDRCGATNGVLYIRLTGDKTFTEVVRAFDNPANTVGIEHYFDGTETDHVFFDDYVNLFAVIDDGNGITLNLRRNT